MSWRTKLVWALLATLAAPASASPRDDDGIAAEDKKEPARKRKPAPSKPSGDKGEKDDRKQPAGVPQQGRPAPARPTPATPSDARPDGAASPARKTSPARPEPAKVKRPAAKADAPREATHRSYDGRSPSRPLHRTADHRYARPHPYHVRAHPHAHHPPPRFAPYRPWYTHWYVHPYWRWTHSTVVVVWLDFTPDPWVDHWAPPGRPGWVWVPGHWSGPRWIPGHWAPSYGPPVYAGARYVYVPGWWVGPVYVDGYWRTEARDGWVWVDGYYLEDGTYVWGHWEPAGDGPDGYVWEPGFWDGEVWVEGFWRPEFRAGYRWVSSWYDDDGVYHAGYWEPVEDKPGHVWIPGWFDGERWVGGEWVTEAEYEAADPERYQPEEGWDDGHEGAATTEADEGPPLAVPVAQ